MTRISPDLQPQLPLYQDSIGHIVVEADPTRVVIPARTPAEAVRHQASLVLQYGVADKVVQPHEQEALRDVYATGRQAAEEILAASRAKRSIQ